MCGSALSPWASRECSWGGVVCISDAVVGVCLLRLRVELCVLRVAPLRWRGRRLRSTWRWAVPALCIDVGCTLVLWLVMSSSLSLLVWWLSLV